MSFDELFDKATKKEPSYLEKITSLGPKKETSSFDSMFDAASKPSKKQEPFTLSGAAKAYGGGYGGGVGGGPGDVASLLGINSPLPIEHEEPELFENVANADIARLKGTHEVTEGFGYEPQNAIERILQQSGQFGGQEGLLGTALGGPAGGLAGTTLGSVVGALYGSAKELGLNDTQAGALLLSVLGAKEVAPKIGSKIAKGSSKVGKQIEKGLEKFESALPSGRPPEEPPPGGGGGGIGPGTTIPQTSGAFQAKEEALASLAPKVQENNLKIKPEFAETNKEVPSLQGRVTGEPNIGDTITKEPFHTEAQAGRETAHEIQKEKISEYKTVNEKYKLAEEDTASHNDIYPKMANENDLRIAELESIEKRSAAQEAVYQDSLALRKIIGTTEGLIEANAGRIMKQADSFASKVNYEETYLGAKAAIKKMVHEMNTGVLESLEASGKSTARVRDADKTYSRFADRFMGDEVSPYLQKKILDAENLFKKSVSDEATYRAVKKAIGGRDSALINKIDREVVAQRMKKYIKDPEKILEPEYKKDLGNLQQLVGKEKAADVDYFLRKSQARNERNSRLARKVHEKAPPKVAQKPISKPTIGEVPEDIDRLFKTRSGIRKAHRELKDKGQEGLFNQIRDSKVSEIFKEGKFGAKELTGNDIVKTIDSHHEVLNELMGEEAVNALYKTGKAYADEALEKEITNAKLQSVAKLGAKAVLSAAGLGFANKWLKLILAATK